jgi:serine/threonine protein phosphatase PrpC
MVRDHDLEQIVAACSPHASQISAMLVQAALSRGGADNISVVVVSLLHDE